MRVFAIGDLHLSMAEEKPMDIFGEVWRDHAHKLRALWRETVREEDWVLIPGDISWAMRLEDALPDLFFLGDLPGSKLLLRGNHDYWWSSRARVEAALPAGMYLMQN
ncbi:MAG: metallophosphoesterase, partial [Clostridia bacterium]|nr:metallophosphoesterase [Clostridia bacterium]